MNDELVSPNLHVTLVHFPIALVLAGVLVELFSFLGWRRSGFRSAGRWMILLGALLMVPTATSGIYALNDVIRRGAEHRVDETWRELSASSPLMNAHDPSAWQQIRDHTLWQAVATSVLLATVIGWIGCSDRMRARLHFVFVILLLWGGAMMIAAAWHGGEAVYRHGVAVEIEKAPMTPIVPATAPTTMATASVTPTETTSTRSMIERIFPPMQMHVILAGLTVSMAAAALGLAIRAATMPAPPVGGVDDIAAALGPDEVGSFITDAERREALAMATHTVPPARFWLLATLLTAATAAAGVWLLAGPDNQSSWNVNSLVQVVFDPNQEHKWFPLNRRSAHVIAGSSILLLTLILAMIGRFAPRRRFVLAFFGLLMLAMIAAQVWLGVLLMFDTVNGPLKSFN